MTSPEVLVMLLSALIAVVVIFSFVGIWPLLFFSVTVLHLLATLGDEALREVGRLGIVPGWLVIAAFGLFSTPKTGRAWGNISSAARLWLFLLLFWSGVSVAWSEFKGDTLGKWLPYAMIIGALIVLAKKRWSTSLLCLRSDMMAIATTIALSLVVSFVLTFVGGAPGFVQGNRYQGLFQNPNTVGQMAVVAFALLLSSPAGSFRLVKASLGAVLISGVILSGSRTAFAGLLVIALVFTVRLFSRKRLAPVAVLGFLAVAASALLYGLLAPQSVDAAVASLTQQTRVSSSSNSGYSPLSGREDLWLRGVDSFRKEPLTGHGLNSSRFVIDPLDRTEMGVTQQAHNSYLEVLIDLGVVGGVIFGALIFVIVWRSLGSLRSSPWLTSTLLAILAMSVTESIIFGITSIVSIIFWMIVVVFAFCGYEERRAGPAHVDGGRYWVRPRTGARPAGCHDRR